MLFLLPDKVVKCPMLNWSKILHMLEMNINSHCPACVFVFILMAVDSSLTNFFCIYFLLKKNNIIITIIIIIIFFFFFDVCTFVYFYNFPFKPCPLLFLSKYAYECY